MVETPVDLNWDKSLVSASTSADAVLRHIKRWLEEGPSQPGWDAVKAYPLAVRSYWRSWPRLQLVDGVVYRKWYTPEGTLERLQMVPPVDYQAELIRQCHVGMTGGHLGLRRTIHQVQRRAYWQGWTADVQRALKECPQCQSFHRGKVGRQGAMQNMTVGAPLERIGIDVTGPFPKSARGNKFMVTIVDHYTKWAEAYPVPNHEAHTVARVLVEQFVARFGVPVEILSDQGAEFCSHLFTELCRVLGTDKIRTSAYRPSTNGATERFHRTLNSIMAKAIEVDQHHWCENVPMALAAYRASKHESTGYSPNMLMFGREVTMPVDLVLGLPEANKEKEATHSEFVARLQARFRTMYEEVRLQLAKVAEKSKDYYDLKVRPAQFQVGDWVWYYLPKATVGRTPKWQRCFEGPFLVVAALDPVNYSIQASARAHAKVVHVDKLKPFYGATPKAWVTKASGPPAVAVHPQSAEVCPVGEYDRTHQGPRHPTPDQPEAEAILEDSELWQSEGMAVAQGGGGGPVDGNVGPAVGGPPGAENTAGQGGQDPDQSSLSPALSPKPVAVDNKVRGPKKKPGRRRKPKRGTVNGPDQPTPPRLTRQRRPPSRYGEWV